MDPQLAEAPMEQDWESIWGVAGAGGPCHGIDGTNGLIGSQHRSHDCSGHQGRRGAQIRQYAAGWPCCRLCMNDDRMQQYPKVQTWRWWDRQPTAGSSAPSSTAPSSSAGAATQEQLQAMQWQQTAVEEQVGMLSQQVGILQLQVQNLLGTAGERIGATGPPAPPEWKPPPTKMPPRAPANAAALAAATLVAGAPATSPPPFKAAQ